MVRNLLFFFLLIDSFLKVRGKKRRKKKTLSTLSYSEAKVGMGKRSRGQRQKSKNSEFFKRCFRIYALAVSPPQTETTLIAELINPPSPPHPATSSQHRNFLESFCQLRLICLLQREAHNLKSTCV